MDINPGFLAGKGYALDRKRNMVLAFRLQDLKKSIILLSTLYSGVED